MWALAMPAVRRSLTQHVNDLKSHYSPPVAVAVTSADQVPEPGDEVAAVADGLGFDPDVFSTLYSREDF